MMSIAIGVCTARAVRAALVAGMLSVATLAAAQTGPVMFQGLKHTAVGDATLRLDPTQKTLEVHTTDPQGKGGVAVHLGKETTSWTANHSTGLDPSLPFGMTWTAVAEGQAISSARLRQSGDRFSLSARFTGATGSASTYAVHVYDNGRLVGSLGGLPPTSAILIPIEWCDLGIFICRFTSRFYSLPDQRCAWDIAAADDGSRKPVPIELPNGVRLTGNQVVLLEEVRPAGHYPYLSFDGLVMQTNADVLTLFSESVR